MYYVLKGICVTGSWLRNVFLRLRLNTEQYSTSLDTLKYIDHYQL